MARISVHIVESPKPEDILDGRQEGEALCGALVHANVATALYTVVNVKTFYEALSRIGSAIQESENAKEGLVPVLHLSMHGSASGVFLTDGTEHKWWELAFALGMIDAVIPATSGIIIVMSTCHGFEGTRMAVPHGKQMFHGLVGPTREIPWKDTVGPFVALYHHVQTRGGTFQNGVRLMNEILGEEVFDCCTASEAAKRAASLKEFLADAAFLDALRRAEPRPELQELANRVEASSGANELRSNDSEATTRDV